MTRFLKRVLVAGFAVVFFGLAQVQAEEPVNTVEKGLAGTGITRIERGFTSNGLRPPFARYWESSRKTVFDDGHTVVENLNRDGTVSIRRTDFPKKGQWIVEQFRPVLHSKLWTRQHNLVANEITTEVYNIDGSLKLVRVVKKAGDMYVSFTDAHGASYSQHWLSGVAGYTLESVTVTPKGSKAYNKFYLLGTSANKVEVFGPDGSLKQVRHLKLDGTIAVVELWDQGKLLSTTRVGTGKERLPHWTFIEIGGVDDPSIPK